MTLRFEGFERYNLVSWSVKHRNNYLIKRSTKKVQDEGGMNELSMNERPLIVITLL